MKSLFSKEKWQQLFYTVSHPSDGFYWIRHGEKGSVAIAILMVVLFGLCFTLNRLLAGFVVNDINERTVNALWEMSGVLMLAPQGYCHRHRLFAPADDCVLHRRNHRQPVCGRK